MDQRIDFKLLAEQLRGCAGTVVPRLLPGGKLIGQEWTCGDMSGGPGKSLRVNIQSGVWMDFASGEKGGDIISLKAAIDKSSMLEAAKSLVGEVNHMSAVSHYSPPPAQKEEAPTKPPSGTKKPDFGHNSGVWCYRDETGHPMFFVVRYDSQEGKNIVPFCWFGDGWRRKSWPAPRPLYGLEQLKDDDKKGVLIVEGEKSADAARQLIGQHYIVMTWPGGSKAYSRVDWSPIYGRNILIWPDADTAGTEAADAIAKLLLPNCPQVKIIKTNKENGWDAADALSEGWDAKSVIAWAKPLVHVAGVKVEMKKAEQPPTIQTVEDMPDLNESVHSIWDKLGIPLTKNGQPIINVHSCSVVLQGLPEFKGMFWYDEFHQKYYTTMPMPRVGGKIFKEEREFSDIDNLYLLKFFQSNLGFTKLSDDMLRKAVIMYCRMNTRNEVKEWFESLKWDGTKRLDKFFVNCYGANDDEYHHAVGRNFWTGMVARIYHPGCQLDTMVVLEGGQGIFKSQSVKAIGGKWYSEVSTSVDRQDFYQVLNGNILLEIAELHAFSKSDVTKIKSIISCATDRYRAPYAHGPENHPRQSIFVGTTNEAHWLRDHSGGRRFWPIRCRNIDLAKIKADREQLFAEAVVRFKSGADWYKTPKDKTLEQQEMRREVDEWQDRVEDYITRPGNQGYCTVLQVAEDGLKFDVKNIDARVQRRIATILSVLGWDKCTKNLGGKSKRVWRPKIGGQHDLFVEDLQDLGIEGAEADLPTPERDAEV
jgi:predicted P-loop ATPase